MTDASLPEALPRLRHNPPQRTSPHTALLCVLRFGLYSVLISLILSLVALPFVPLTWWRIFRRCASIGAFVSLWICVKNVEGRSLRSYGLSGAGKWQILIGLLFGLSVLALMLGIGLASGVYVIELTPHPAKFWRVVLGFLPAALLISVLEELIFRGFLLQQLLSVSRPLAVILSSAVYAAVHLRSSTLTLATWMELGGLFLLGGVLSMSYLLTGRLYLSLGLHAALAYGARINKLLIGIPHTSLAWLVGTSRLVNGVMTWVAILLLAGLVAGWARISHQRGGVTHGRS